MITKAFNATTGFLYRVAQTRTGAEHVINAGLFQAIRECSLFMADPDLGFGFSDPKGLQCYYDLVYDVVRVVLACILSRGPQNRLAIDAGQQFLVENRSVAVTVLKRNAGIGGSVRDGVGDLKKLADMFAMLYLLTGSIGVCSSPFLHPPLFCFLYPGPELTGGPYLKPLGLGGLF